MKSLKKRVLKGIAWRTVVDFGEMFLQIVFTAVLARLLSRADFGLVAMALLVNRFLHMMTQVGFGSAIIQSQEVSEAQVSAIFYINLGINLLVSIVCYLIAPLAAEFFNEPRLISIIRVLAWLISINGLGFPQILLRKKLEFGGFSILQISSMIAGNIVGIGLALKGFGVWALVFRMISQHLLYSVLIWPVAKWRPVKPDFFGIGKLVRFGLNMLASNIFYYFSQNMASIIIGKFIGAETLGAFNIAYNLALVPAQKIQGIITGVMGPAFAQIHQDLRDFRKKFFISLFSLCFFFLPAMLGLAAVAQNLVLVVYGEKWREAGIFLTFLAVVGMFKGMQHLMNSVVIAKGWALATFGITVAETMISLPLLFLCLYYFNIFGLIIAYVAVSLFTFGLTSWAAQKAVEDETVFWRATNRSFLAAIPMFLLALGTGAWLPVGLTLLLGLQVLLGVLIYAVLRYILFTDEERAIILTWPFTNLLFNINKIRQ